MNNKNRWYDKYENFAALLNRIKHLRKQDRENILIYIKDLISDIDPKLFDRHVHEFPLSVKRRWYDKDPYSWLIINALKYVDDDAIEKITTQTNEFLENL